MPSVYYWPQKNRPQPLSYLHRLSLDGVILGQGPNSLTEHEWERVLAHPDLARLTADGVIVLASNTVAVEYIPPPRACPALALINGSDVVRDIAIIPTIGQASAKRILSNRPNDGYSSLEQVWEMNPEVLGGRMQVDPIAVSEWGGVDG